MIYSRLFAVAATLAGFVSAQTDFTTCCDVSPATVDSPTRASWCRAQMNTCRELCPNQQTSVNTCDNNLLTYECSCATGNTPNISDFMQTLPSLQCDEWRAQCTEARPNDLEGQTFCQSFICGSRNATEEAPVAGPAGPAGSASSAVSSATASAAGSATASSSAAAETTSSAAVAAYRIGRDYGIQAVAVGLLAVFGLAL